MAAFAWSKALVAPRRRARPILVAPSPCSKQQAIQPVEAPVRSPSRRQRNVSFDTVSRKLSGSSAWAGAMAPLPRIRSAASTRNRAVTAIRIGAFAQRQPGRPDPVPPPGCDSAPSRAGLGADPRGMSVVGHEDRGKMAEERLIMRSGEYQRRWLWNHQRARHADHSADRAKLVGIRSVSGQFPRMR
jgi:hypothetical protein